MTAITVSAPKSKTDLTAKSLLRKSVVKAYVKKNFPTRRIGTNFYNALDEFIKMKLHEAAAYDNGKVGFDELTAAHLGLVSPSSPTEKKPSKL